MTLAKWLTLVSLIVLIHNGRDIQASGVVSSATPEATQAGVEILNAGGNAIDAAVAVAFTLGVTEPACSGIGGQTFMLIHPPNQPPFVIHGTSYAPRLIPAGITVDDLVGRRATTTPSTVRVLEFAWRKYGSGRITWKQLLAPAIRHAEEGYSLGHFRRRTLLRLARALLGDEDTAREYLGKDSKVPALGATIKHPLLARALRRLAEAGADDFYKGQIARDIAADMKANGGWLTLKDLQSFPEPQTMAPLEDQYRRYKVYSLPPPTGGWVVLLSLNILERAPKGALSVENSEARTIWLAETLRISHANREDAPIADFKSYAEQVARTINDQTVDALLRKMALPEPRKRAGETTHFSVVDSRGLAVGVTASINSYYGARIAHPRWGFLYNNYMREFVLNQPANPYNLQPGAMPYSSMSATILAREGKPVLVLGSPGGKRIISAVVQVISHWVDVGKGIQAAVAAPRLHVVPDEDLFLEVQQRQIPLPLLIKLETRGYNVVRPLSSLYKEDRNPFFGGVHALALEEGVWVGAADPRRDGTVAKAEK
jgi:gamma-glutamyltranspeptidase/glutathione hydrolase